MKLQVYGGRNHEDMDLLKLDVSPFCLKIKYSQKKNESVYIITNIMSTLDIIGYKQFINKLLPCLDFTFWQRMCAQEAGKMDKVKDI